MSTGAAGVTGAAGTAEAAGAAGAAGAARLAESAAVKYVFPQPVFITVAQDLCWCIP